MKKEIINFTVTTIPLTDILASNDTTNDSKNNTQNTQNDSQILAISGDQLKTNKNNLLEINKTNRIVPMKRDEIPTNINLEENFRMNEESNSVFEKNSKGGPIQQPEITETTETEEIKSYGCKHYKRKCLVQFSCCNRFYECRLCHNKLEDHKCNRKTLSHLICLICFISQPFSSKCKNCKVNFSLFICRDCKLLTDDLNTYHCKECGVCRKGNRGDYFHCGQCDACLPIYTKEFHLTNESTQMDVQDVKGDTSTGSTTTRTVSSTTSGTVTGMARVKTHVENTLRSTCPICAQDLFYSTSPVVLMHCGHSIHKKCFISYKNKSFQCPICLRSSSNTKTVNQRIDYILSQCTDLNNQKSINMYEAKTVCFDCQGKYTGKYTYLYNKCRGCGSYNTRINELYKREDHDEETE